MRLQPPSHAPHAHTVPSMRSSSTRPKQTRAWIPILAMSRSESAASGCDARVPRQACAGQRARAQDACYRHGYTHTHSGQANDRMIANASRENVRKVVKDPLHPVALEHFALFQDLQRVELLSASQFREIHKARSALSEKTNLLRKPIRALGPKTLSMMVLPRQKMSLSGYLLEVDQLPGATLCRIAPLCGIRRGGCGCRHEGRPLHVEHDLVRHDR